MCQFILCSFHLCLLSSNFLCLFHQVYNVIPSISSITGISPQRYLWRVCIALHVGPRFLTSIVYHRFYLSMVPSLPASADSKSYIFHVWLAFALNLAEQAALIGVTYVSNRENYRKNFYLNKYMQFYLT